MIEIGSPDKPKVLIVDDEAQVLSSLADLLRKDFHIFATSDVDEAQRLLETQNVFSLVISDQRMPALTGAELLARVAKISPDTARILLTGYSDIEAIIEAVNQGQIVQYITKPWDGVELLGILKPIAERHRLIQENRLLIRQMARLNQSGWDSSARIETLERMQSTLQSDNEALKASCARLDLSIREMERRVIDRTAQLTAANRELMAFSYSVSHDLRAPLRSIDGFSQALLDEYQEILDNTGKGYLQRVRKATQRMGLLIDDMLKLSRITQAQMNREAVDLGGMFREIAEAHKKNHPDRIVPVTVQEGVTVQGDPYLLRIALENLLDNACKFTGKQANPRIEFGTAVIDGVTACFVRDNGAGFDMAYMGQLFGAFQRLHTAEEFPGTGIGLATVQRIIHRHGGRVWAEGEVGRGATFYFTLAQSESAG